MRAMFRLARLEWIQNNIKEYLWISVAIAWGSLVISWIMNLTGKNMACTWLMNICLIVYVSILFAIIVIDKCKGGAAERVFSYPIRRRTLVLAKVISVWSAMVPIWFLTRLLAYSALLFFCQTGVLDIAIEFKGCYVLNMFLDTILLVNSCIFPLFIGVLLNSSKAGIASSVIIALIIQRMKITDGPLLHFYYCFVSVGIVVILLIVLMRVAEKREI